MTLAHSGQNDHRFADAVKHARKLGGEAGEGVEALPKLFVLVASLAADGVIDTTPDKHGDGIDDAKHFYNNYVEASSKKAVHDHTDKGKKANISKLRQGVKLGALYPRVDTKDLLERTVTLRGNAEVAGQDVYAAYPAYIAVARLQLAEDNVDAVLTDEQIVEAVSKPDAKEKTVEGAWKRAAKIFEDLIVGKDGVKDQGPEAIQVMDVCKARLAMFAAERQTAEDQAEIARLEARGYSVTPHAHSDQPSPEHLADVA